MNSCYRNNEQSIITKIVKNVMYRFIIISKAFCCIPLEHIASFVRKSKSKMSTSDRVSNALSRITLNRIKSSVAKRAHFNSPTRKLLSSTSKKPKVGKCYMYTPKQPKKINKCFQIDPICVEDYDQRFKYWNLKEAIPVQRKDAKDLSGMIIDKSYMTQNGQLIVKLKKKPFSVKRLFSSKARIMEL